MQDSQLQSLSMSVLDLVAVVSSRLTQHRGTYFPQLRWGEETIIYSNYIPREYIGDHPVRSYECLTTVLLLFSRVAI